MAAPWFKIYSQEFLSDPKVKMLDHDQIGKLVMLWAFANEDGCCIPSSPKAIGKLLGIQSEKQMVNHLVWITRFFVPLDGDDSRLVSIRLQEEQKAYQEKCDKLKANGSKGGRPKNPETKPEGYPDGLANGNQMAPEEGRGKREVEKEKEKNPAPPSAAPERTRKPREPKKPEMPKAGPTVSQILGEFDPASYWALSKVFPGARSSNHRTAAIYWVAAITDGVSGPALVKAGKAFFDSLPPDQVSKGAIPQLAKWLEQEGYRSFLPEDSPRIATASTESERKASLANADAYLKAKCENPSLTFAEWSMNHAA